MLSPLNHLIFYLIMLQFYNNSSINCNCELLIEFQQQYNYQECLKNQSPHYNVNFYYSDKENLLKIKLPFLELHYSFDLYFHLDHKILQYLKKHIRNYDKAV